MNVLYELPLKLASLRPVPALVLVGSSFTTALVITDLIDPNALTVAFRTVAISPMLAWPCIVASGLRERFGSDTRANLGHWWTVCGAVFVDHAVFVPVLMNMPNDEFLFFPLVFLCWMVGFFGPIYLMWNCARLLVEVEEGKRVSIDRIIGTFFAFFFLIIGVFFLQKRIRRVLYD